MLRFVGISPVSSDDFMRLYSLVLHNEHDAKKEFREVSRKLFYYPRTFRGAIAGAENPGKTYLCTDDKKRFLVPTGVSRMHKGRRRPPEPVNGAKKGAVSLKYNCTNRRAVIPSQCAHWRGNPPVEWECLPKCIQKVGGIATPVTSVTGSQ